MHTTPNFVTADLRGGSKQMSWPKQPMQPAQPARKTKKAVPQRTELMAFKLCVASVCFPRFSRRQLPGHPFCYVRDVPFPGIQDSVLSRYRLFARHPRCSRPQRLSIEARKQWQTSYHCAQKAQQQKVCCFELPVAASYHRLCR